MAAEKKPKTTQAQISEQFTDIAKDLFSIEVSLILRNCISAQKMPSPRHALLDIGKAYCAALQEMEIWRQDYLRRMGQPALETNQDMFTVKRLEMGFFTPMESLNRLGQGRNRLVSHNIDDELGGFDAFDVLRTWANSHLQDLFREIYLSPEQIAILPRIKENADLFKGMFSAICMRDPVLNGLNPTESEVVTAPPPPNLGQQLDALRTQAEDKITPDTVVNLSKVLNRKRTVSLANEYTRADLVTRDDIAPLPLREQELVMLRKVWELGTEVIAMQTIVQLDGDVITRLDPYYMDEKKYPRLHDYHNEAINVALKHWSEMVAVAQELISAVVRGVSRRVTG